MRIGGVIIAGGKATRMQQQVKPLLQLHGTTLLEHVIARARGQVDFLLLNSNHDPSVFAGVQLPIVGDSVPGQRGPLLGIAAAMEWYRNTPLPDNSSAFEEADAIACFAADVPRFPVDFVSSLKARLLATHSDIALCRHNAQLQPLFSLWSCRSYHRLNELIASGCYGPKQVYQEFTHVIVDIHSDHPGEFLNINTREDLRQAALLIPDSNKKN